MTRITLDSDHSGAVRLSRPQVRFDETHEASVLHDRAKELVASHEDVSFAYPIPTEYDDLREVAAALPTDRVAGNDTADQIVSFLEQFEADEIERLCDDPSLLVVEVQNRREKYEVAEPESDGTEPEDPGTDGEE